MKNNFKTFHLCFFEFSVPYETGLWEGAAWYLAVSEFLGFFPLSEGPSHFLTLQTSLHSLKRVCVRPSKPAGLKGICWRKHLEGRKSKWKWPQARGCQNSKGRFLPLHLPFNFSLQKNPNSPAASPIPKCRLMSLKPLKSLRWVHGQSPSDSHKYLQWLKPQGGAEVHLSLTQIGLF